MKFTAIRLSVLFLSLMFVHAASGQSDKRNISGSITDESGLPMVGVTVFIKGSMSQGTVSSTDGRFSMDAAPDDTLVFTYLNYLTKEIQVGTQTFLNVVMQEDLELIDAVVVTGYGNGILKESLTSSISNISSTKLSKSSGANVSTALAGKISGINFRMADGQPGAATTINIRNMGSALFVIDGVQSTQGSFNNLDFNDIESISVLKDASAAIYGVQAANGAIVVTTKSGIRNRRPVVTLQSYFGMQSWFRYPQPADVRSFVGGHIQSATITGLQPQITPEQIEAYNNGTLKGFDWYRFVVRQSSPQYYVNANVSGGNDNVNYYISMGSLDQRSVINNFGGFRRFNVQANVDAKIGNRLKVGARFNGRYEDTKHPAVPGDDVWAAIFAIWRNPPTSFPYANGNPNYPAVTSNTPSTNFAILNYDRSGYYRDTYRVGQISVNAEYDLLEGLKLKALGSYYLGQRWYDVQEYTYDLYSYDPASDS